MNGPPKNRAQEWRRQQGSRLVLAIIAIAVLAVVGIVGVSTDALGPLSTILQNMFAVE